jgi:hypothetical protein
VHSQTNIGDIFETSAKKDPLFIPTPSERHSGAVSYLTTFNALAESPAPKPVGVVADMATFSRSLGLPDNAKKEEFWIKDTGTGFYIPPQYEQFEEAARTMIARYYATHGDDGPVAMAIHQAVIQPNANDPRPFTGAHKDINLSRISADGKAPNVYSMIVSDALGTGFSDYQLTEDDLKAINAADDPNKALETILNNPEIKYTTSATPGTITAFPATADHALANPEVATRRTVMLMSFFPEGEILSPGQINNPWLSTAIAERDQKAAYETRAPNTVQGQNFR